MNIRQRMLFAFVTLILACTGAMTILAYNLSRAALEREIRANLQGQATTLLRHLEGLLAERLQNLASWRRLEVMQELRVEDVDKRLARFLADLVRSYHGLYRSLYCVRDGRIVAASAPGMIGRPARPRATWRRLVRDGAPILLSPPDGGDAAGLEMQTPIPDEYGRGVLGSLHARFDWVVVLRRLDEAARSGGRLALLLDRDGRIIAASRTLRERGWTGQDAERLLGSRWVGGGGHSLWLDQPGRGEFLAEMATPGGTGDAAGIAWRLLLLVPVDAAFAPVHRLLWGMLALMLLTTTGGVLLARRLSGRIARPLQLLTRHTRAFPRQRKPLPELDTGDEVAELAQAYRQMTTSLEQYERELVRIGRLAAAGETAAHLAHEIRTPLGILRSSAQLLERRPGLDERGREMVGYILDECDRINRLVSRLLEAARPRPPRFAPVEVPTLLEQVAGLLRAELEQAGITLLLDRPAGAAPFTCDREQMQQVLLNLLTNAIAVLERGGRIELGARREPGRLRLWVGDSGPGVPAEERERILEPFVSHRPGGTGLGLTVVQQLIRLHQGHLYIGESALGGALFEVELPEGGTAGEEG